LELLAVYRTGFETFSDSFADASAILWTLLFWTGIFCCWALLCARSAPRSKLIRVNQFVCRGGIVLISAYYLRHWLQGWWSEQAAPNITAWLVIVVVALAYWLVRRRRIRAPSAAATSLPSWEDCFSFAVFPLLLVTGIILLVKIANHVVSQKLVQFAAHAGSPAGKTARTTRPNIVLIVADSLRSQSMSLYEYSDKTTPFLDSFAKTGQVYLNMHSNSTTTAISLSAILTGKHPLTLGRPTPEIAPRYNSHNLLYILREHGYRTAAVTSNADAGFRSLGLSADLSDPEDKAHSFLTLSWLRDWGIYPTLLGEQIYADLSVIFPFLGFPRRTSYYGESEDTLNLARERISQLREPFFLLVHIHQPHDPYLPPSFRDHLRRFVKQFGVTDPSELKKYATYHQSAQPVVNIYKKQYESSIKRVDSDLKMFFRYFEATSMASNSLLIVTADHGESFERGYLNHGEELYENSTHVPLVIRFPGQQTGQRVAGLVQSIDIAPTILRALNISIPVWMDGQPLVPATQPEKRLTVGVNYKRPENDTVYPLPTKLAVWGEDYKLIVTCGSDRPLLYDLTSDPEEQTDLSLRHPKIVDDLKSGLKRQLAKQPGVPRLDCPNL
jgi:arylsulfatase A-like enzyme